MLVDAETNERLHDLGHRLAEQKMNLETFLQVTNQTPDAAARDAARRRRARGARSTWRCARSCAAEGLEPTDEEIDEELERPPTSMGVDGRDCCATNLRDTGRVVTFNAEVAKMKASSG